MCCLINNAQKPGFEEETAENFRKNSFDPKNTHFEERTEYCTRLMSSSSVLRSMAFFLAGGCHERRYGYSETVFNITSISGMVLKSGIHFSYNTSKAAVNHLTKFPAFEVSNHRMKLRINTISPVVFHGETRARIRKISFQV